ncbi:hypothetical protein D3C76_1409420 [compost metagenome]
MLGIVAVQEGKLDLVRLPRLQVDGCPYRAAEVNILPVDLQLRIVQIVAVGREGIAFRIFRHNGPRPFPGADAVGLQIA